MADGSASRKSFAGKRPDKDRSPLKVWAGDLLIGDCGSGPTVPDGTVFPAGHAQALRTQFAVPGSTMLRTAVGSGLSNIVAYAATQGTGYALMLFNLDENNATTVAVALNDATRASFTGTTSTYDKAIYDLSQNNVGTDRAAARHRNVAVKQSPADRTPMLGAMAACVPARSGDELGRRKRVAPAASRMPPAMNPTVDPASSVTAEPCAAVALSCCATLVHRAVGQSLSS